MRYLVQYPLFFILTEEGKDGFALVDLQERSSKAKGIPILTDEEGAQEFLDARFVGWRLGLIPDEPFFARLLNVVKQHGVSLVAFDPWRVGARTAMIPIEEMLEQVEIGPE
jgi:hypothetical protein